MFGDTLYAVERSMWIAIAVWGIASAVAGVAMLFVATRSETSAVLFRAAGRALLWIGLVEFVAGGVALHAARIRDLDSATMLDHALWLACGVALGGAVAAVAVAIASLARGRSRAWIGAGSALALHCAVLAIFFSAALQRIAL